MESATKFSIGLWLFGQLSDRFTIYHEQKPLKRKFEEASKVKEAQGLEIGYPMDFKDEEIDTVKKMLEKYEREVSMIIVDHFTHPKWMNGSFTSLDENLRKDAIRVTKRAMDISKELGCSQVNLWLGQDGYDYVFQTDYREAWDHLIEGLRECAKYRPDVKVAIEYKLKEPRTHILISTVGKALVLANAIGLENVGVTLDVGHAFAAFENAAESAVLLSKWKKLFHLHLNDNFRDWDHDMIVGSVNFWDYLELFFWLKVIGYNGWYSMDIYPYREDVAKACEQSIENIKAVMGSIDRIGVDVLMQAIKEGNIVNTTAILRKILK